MVLHIVGQNWRKHHLTACPSQTRRGTWHSETYWQITMCSRHSVTGILVDPHVQPSVNGALSPVARILLGCVCSDTIGKRFCYQLFSGDNTTLTLQRPVRIKMLETIWKTFRNETHVKVFSIRFIFISSLCAWRKYRAGRETECGTTQPCAHCFRGSYTNLVNSQHFHCTFVQMGKKRFIYGAHIHVYAKHASETK